MYIVSDQSGNKAGRVGYKRPPVEHQFQPGNTPPGGRPKGSVSVTRYIKQLLEANEDEQAKKLAQSLILNAAKGNGTAIKEVMSRVDGPIKQEIEVNDVTLTPEEREAKKQAILAAIAVESKGEGA